MGMDMQHNKSHPPQMGPMQQADAQAGANAFQGIGAPAGPSIPNQAEAGAEGLLGALSPDSIGNALQNVFGSHKNKRRR